jgi:hypothetical protein
MDSVFLSYTYSPPPEFEEETNELVRSVRIMLEAMDIRQVLTGEDLGGQQLSAEVKERIQRSQALIALETPWKQLAGDQGYIASDWVRREFAQAETLNKELIAVVHEKVVLNSAFKDREHTVFHPPDHTLVLLKLMRTIALWKRRLGCAHNVEIRPTNLSDIIDEDNPAHLCEYRTVVEHDIGDWRKASFWHEPGCALAYLTGIPDGAKVQMRVKMGQVVWQSAFALLDRIELSRKEN